MNNNNESNPARLGGIFLIIGWVIAIGLVTLLVHTTLYSPKQPDITHINGNTTITLYRDEDSHFRIMGMINGVKVTFLIDTGATTIAVNEKVANQAQLARLSNVITQTAGGESVGYFTKIDSLKIAEIEFDNLSAIIVPDMGGTEALLGMNALKKFNIQQTADTLILSIPEPS